MHDVSLNTLDLPELDPCISRGTDTYLPSYSADVSVQNSPSEAFYLS